MTQAHNREHTGLSGRTLFLFPQLIIFKFWFLFISLPNFFLFYFPPIILSFFFFLNFISAFDHWFHQSLEGLPCSFWPLNTYSGSGCLSTLPGSSNSNLSCGSRFLWQMFPTLSWTQWTLFLSCSDIIPCGTFHAALWLLMYCLLLQTLGPLKVCGVSFLPQCPYSMAQGPAPHQPSMKICWINEWVNETRVEGKEVKDWNGQLY